MYSERVFGIAIVGYTTYLIAIDNLYAVQSFIRSLFFFLPFGWPFDISRALTNDTFLLVFCLAVPFLLFSGFFRIKL
jgi:hypothetical protein